MRGGHQMEHSSLEQNQTDGLQIGRSVYNMNFRRLTSAGCSVALRFQLDHVLRVLVQNEGQVVSREELIEIVWNGNYCTGPKALTHSICKLRKIFAILGDDDTQIVTVPKFGYSLCTTTTNEVFI